MSKYQKHKAYYHQYYQKHKDKFSLKSCRSRQKKRELINRVKCVPCMDCGIQYNPWVMDFDHRDSSTKKFNVGQHSTRSQKAIEEEISKCDVVCSNCHRERTHLRQINKTALTDSKTSSKE